MVRDLAEVAVRMPGWRPPTRTDSGGGLAVPLVWPLLPASAPLTEPNLPFLDPRTNSQLVRARLILARS